MGAEKRRYPRLRAKVKVKVVKVSSEIKDLIAIDTVTRDIGVAGICIVTRKLLKVDDIIILDITLPGGRTIKATGLVKWVNEQGALKGLGLNDFFVGVKFVKIDENDRTEIGKLLFDSLHEFGSI